MSRVEFSKPNMEISITVTKASKLRSFGRYIVMIFIIFIIMFLIILTIFLNNIFFSFWQLFCTVKRVQKSKKKIIPRKNICTPMQNVKIMKKCSKNSVFFTIRVSKFGASIFVQSNGPISGFRIIRISGLQHCRAHPSR